jgi:hypothetical protein
MSSPIPRVSGPTWDERRNTSRVFPVPPDALPLALAALERFRRFEPAHAEWIADGAPNLSEAEHFARFGVPYRSHRSRKTTKGESGGR